jgi:ATP-binding cassette subfamily C (CFTR/MRP) protein 1
MMRGGLISMLYGKATKVGLTDVDTASSLTLMSADIERIVTGMETGHEVRATFLDVGHSSTRTQLFVHIMRKRLGMSGIVLSGKLSQGDLIFSDRR